jgi:uncharacterized protein
MGPGEGGGKPRQAQLVVRNRGAGVYDPLHASKPDSHPNGDRWHTIGLVGPVLLLVIHTWPEDEGEPVGRIISARKATSHERKAYEEGNF